MQRLSLRQVPGLVDSLSERVATATRTFVQTTWGQRLLAISLVGPVTFLPTVWEAWTAPNIDALRTLTWPLMVVVNSVVYVSVSHQGEWRVRLSMIFWILLMFLTWLATLVR